MRSLLVLAFAGGCSVDIGAGSIAPIAFDSPIDPGETSPPISLTTEFEFLSADQSTSIADHYGNKLGAVSAIDIEVDSIGISDGNGAPVAGGALVLAFEGVTIDRAGERVRLPDSSKQKVLAAVANRVALTVSLQVTVDWSAPSPPNMSAHLLLQPVVIVDALRAL